jgi:hypothetical protein
MGYLPIAEDLSARRKCEKKLGVFALFGALTELLLM